MPTSPEKRSHRDSWPPTQIYLKPTVPTKATPLPALDDIDDDPLTYFLTPAPDVDDADLDLDEAMLDFDAGIEGAGRPREMVRSVSPSTLDGLRKPGLMRPVSPDTCSDATMSDCDGGGGGSLDDDDYEDDDDEDYIRFSPGQGGGLLGPRGSSLADHRPRSPALGASRSPTRPTTLGTAGAALLAPPGSPTLRGRARGHGPASPSSSRRRPGQLWRVPSPDVWSIEEETEEELVRSGGSPMGSASDGPAGGKPKKRVRFVLPAKTD